MRTRYYEVGETQLDGFWKILDVIPTERSCKYVVICTLCDDTISERSHYQLSHSKKCQDCKDVKYMPSPKEIRAECEQIQSEWSRYEERKRRQAPPTPWELPVVGTGFN